MAQLEELLDKTGLDLYRTNPFRVMGVSTRATPKELRRQQERMERMRNLGMELETDRAAKAMPLVPPANAEERRASVERLADPCRRFVDEIFWFVPIAGDDPAWKSFEAGDEAGALRSWREQASADGADGAIARHNLAVAHFVNVLEGRSSSWTVMTESWSGLHRDEAFWKFAASRVVEIDDARLTLDYLERLRETVVPLVLLLGCEMAQKLLVGGDAAGAGKIVKELRGAARGVEGDVFDDVVRRCMQPLRSRIKTAIDGARRHWEATPIDAPRLLKGLKEQCRPTLDQVDLFLDAGDSVRSNLRDTLADAYSEGGWSYANRSCDWLGAVEFVRMAVDISEAPARRKKFEDEIETLRKNNKSGNDWCAPGYWDLPAETISLLEAAREKARSGSYEEALTVLLGMAPSLGKILSRCIAYCLSMEAIQVGNQALSDWNSANVSTPTRVALWEALMSGDGRYRMPSTNPHVPTPPCLVPSCRSTGYQRWMEFEQGGNKLYMCNDCWQRHLRELSVGRKKKNDAQVLAFEKILLAHEMDPGDSGVKSNLDIMKGNLEIDQIAIPTSARLRKSLGGDALRITKIDVDGGSDCFFCKTNPHGPDDAIVVPMVGPERKVKMLLGEGREYQVSDVRIPRCPSCRSLHESVGRQDAIWRRNRDAAGARERFPELASGVDAAKRKLSDAVASWNRRLGKAEELQEAAERALEEHLRRAGGFGWMSRSLIAGFVSLGAILGTEVAGDLLYGACAAVGVGVLGYVAAWHRSSRRKERDAPLHAAREALRKATEELDAVRVGKKTKMDQIETEVQSAERALDDAVNQAFAAWETTNPRPAIPAGIRLQSDYVEAPVLARLKGERWTFGSATPTGTQSSDAPKGVKGLVGEGV